jgi:hypothetical protein
VNLTEPLRHFVTLCSHFGTYLTCKEPIGLSCLPEDGNSEMLIDFMHTVGNA